MKTKTQERLYRFVLAIIAIIGMVMGYEILGLRSMPFWQSLAGIVCLGISYGTLDLVLWGYRDRFEK